jgi:hypothetical protein
MKIFSVTMIRNEIDIVESFLEYNSKYFDGMLLADMQSSDGTREAIDRASEKDDRIKCYNLPYLAKYQSEVVRVLAEIALQEGADWLFCLDADEFLKSPDRDHLEMTLRNFGSEVMHLPWINLIPTAYGSFNDFDAGQKFHWTGRVSRYVKVAFSAQYAMSNPDYTVTMGCHDIRPTLFGPHEAQKLGIPLFHIPVRSAERTSYKAVNAVDLQRRKHNHREGEGKHHKSNICAIEDLGCDATVLNALAADYGATTDPVRPVDPVALDWPTLQLSDFSNPRNPRARDLTMLELRQADAGKDWEEFNMPPGAIVRGRVADKGIELSPTPVRGNGTRGPMKFDPLDKTYVARNRTLDAETIVEALVAMETDPPIDVFSAWTDLVPTQAALFSILKPRRYVELGVHNGMSFFSACSHSERLRLGTECVAIDSWEGDPHAGMHDSSVFENFKQNISRLFPAQMYIQGYFDEASKLFQDASIDVVHIDGFHSYDAVRHDFETWRPKMSNRGVMLFHDINVHERDFGVWRFWEEIAEELPHASVAHGHGLGVLYVGDAENDAAELFRVLRNVSKLERLSKRYLEAKIFAQHRRNRESAAIKRELAALKKERDEAVAARNEMAQHLAKTQRKIGESTDAFYAIARDKWWRRTQVFRGASNIVRKIKKRPLKTWPEHV